MQIDVQYKDENEDNRCNRCSRMDPASVFKKTKRRIKATKKTRIHMCGRLVFLGNNKVSYLIKIHF